MYCRDGLLPGFILALVDDDRVLRSHPSLDRVRSIGLKELSKRLLE